MVGIFLRNATEMHHLTEASAVAAGIICESRSSLEMFDAILDIYVDYRPVIKPEPPFLSQLAQCLLSKPFTTPELPS